jgi:hypothetical protein
VPPPTYQLISYCSAILTIMLLFSLNAFSQSGQKWSTGLNTVSNGDALGTSNNAALIFKVNNTERMRLTPGGYLGICTNNPLATLDVKGNIRSESFVNFGTGLLQYDINGFFKPFQFPGNPALVLLGDGTFGPINDYNWHLSGNNLLMVPTGMLGIGTNDPIEKLDVNGNANIRGYLYVQDGVIIGKRVKSEKMESDTIKTVGIDADTVNTREMKANNARITNIFIDGNNSRITSTTGAISFTNNNLTTAGTITAGFINTSNLHVSYTTQDSMRVSGILAVGNTIKLNGNVPPDPQNPSLLWDEITSSKGVLCLGRESSFSDVKFGLGTRTPQVNFHLKGITDANINPHPLSTVIRIEDQLINNPVQYGGDRTSWWDFVVSAQGRRMQFITASSEFSANKNILTLTEAGRIGIGTENPSSRMEINNGTLKLTGSDDLGEGNARFLMDIENATGQRFMELKNINGSHFVVQGDGRVGIGPATFSGPNLLTIKGNDAFPDPTVFIQANEWTTGKTATLVIGSGNHYIRTLYGDGLQFHSTDRFIFEGTTSNNAIVNVKGKVGIGIGSTNPDAFLHVTASTGITGLIVSTDHGSGSGYGVISRVTGDNTKSFIVDNSGNETFVVNGDGSVGIGTNAPSQKLEIVGNIKTNGQVLCSVTNNNMKSFVVNNSGNETFVVTGDGSVGIGLNSPTQKLDVAGNVKIDGQLHLGAIPSSSGNYVLVDDGTGLIGKKNLDQIGDNMGTCIADRNIILGDHWLSNDGSDKGIKVAQNGDVTMLLGNGNSFEVMSGSGIPDRRGISISNDPDGAMNFWMNGFQEEACFNFRNFTPAYTDGGGSTHPAETKTFMTIRKNGNIGIGTSSPGSNLHVHNSQPYNLTQRKLFEVSGIGDGNLYQTYLYVEDYRVAVGFFNEGESAPSQFDGDNLSVKGSIASYSPTVSGGPEPYIRLIPDAVGSLIQTNNMENSIEFKGSSNHKTRLICGGIDIIHTDGELRAKLRSDGSFWAQEAYVQLTSPWSDFVFEPDYSLMPIDKLKNYIIANKHLPGIPSASEVKEQGVNLGQMDNQLLQKIEELTLYIIDQEKRIVKLEEENAEIRASENK